MVDANILKQVIIDQHITFPHQSISRDVYATLRRYDNTPHIIILLGVRRCGKSTLLQMIRQGAQEADYYINFDDDRLVQFALEDFQQLYELFIELYGEQKTFYFDEIQNIPEWERFVRRLHDNGYKIYITGSNATLFSQELSTRLTGRYVEIPVYPFSYTEFIRYKEPELLAQAQHTTIDIGKLRNLCTQYLTIGGFPNYVESQNKEYLQALYEGILYRDIVSRYRISAIRPFKELVFYLASNVSKDVSYNALKNLIGIKNATTVTDYCHYLQMSFMCFFINRYDPSVKKQIHHSKKIYFIDTALACAIGFRHSDDWGRLIENIVFIELKRRGLEVFFHRKDKECDFIIRQQGKITQAIQVCYRLTDEKTKQREFAGLIEAMSACQLDKGTIITWDEEETSTINSEDETKTIYCVPLFKWLLNHKFNEDS